MTQATFTYAQYRDIILLALCWAWTFSLATLITFVGPLSARSIGGDDFFSTFTVGIFVIGTAICNIPSTALFNKYGRTGGFVIGCFCLIFGGILGCIAISNGLLGLLIVGSCIMGFGVGMGQFYRFAAIDIASEEHKSWAVTTVLTGGCFAAFLGPTLGIATRDMFATQYVGCYFMMVLLGVINLATVMLVKFPPPITPDVAILPDLTSLSFGGRRPSIDSNHSRDKRHSDPEVLMQGMSGHSQSDVRSAVKTATSASAATAAAPSKRSNSNDIHQPLHNTIENTADHNRSSVSSVSNVSSKGRSILSIVMSVGFVVPTLINTISQVLMMIVMINCTLELSNLGFSFVYISIALDFHFFAMFGTGFLTGYLIKEFGCLYVCIAGSILMGISYIIFVSGVHLANFIVGDILLGIAWNMLFSAGTVMLSNCYEALEQNAIQSINEFIINSISGIFTIVSGFILATFGWHDLIIACIAVYLTIGGVTTALCLYYKAYYGRIVDYNEKFQRASSISGSQQHIQAIKSALHKGPEVNSALHQSNDGKSGVTASYSSDEELLKENNHAIV